MRKVERTRLLIIEKVALKFKIMGKAERTRLLIIEKAAILFNKRGVAATSIDDVLEAAKIAKGCLYGHFESKDALVLATVDYLIERIGTKAEVIITKKTSAKSKLYAFMELYRLPLDSFTEGGYPILNFGVESENIDVIVRKKVRDMVRNTTSILTLIITEGITNKEFSKHINPNHHALKILALMEGGMLLDKVIKSSSLMEILVEMLKDDMEYLEID